MDRALSTVADASGETMVGMGMATLGERVQAKRKAMGLSQEKLGDAVGLSKQGISAIENGVTLEPQASTLEQIARRLKTSTGWLLTGRGSDESFSDDRPMSQFAGPDPAILHEAVTLLLHDLDHGGPRTARSASDLLMDLYRRIEGHGGRLSPNEERAFEAASRARALEGGRVDGDDEADGRRRRGGAGR